MLNRLAGVQRDLPPKAAGTLALLVARTGSIVTKAELMDALWPDGFVEEGNLTQQIYVIRRALDRHGLPNCIRTYARRGYGFHPPAEPRPKRLLRPIRIVVALGAACFVLVLAGAGAARPRQLDGEALHAYTLGRYFWNLRSVAGMTRSVGYFRRVVSLAPSNALGYAALADAYTELADFERPCRDCETWHRNAVTAAARAIAIDPSAAEAHVANGMIARVFGDDERSAAREFETALALDPANALANQWYGNLLVAQGSVTEGVRRLLIAAGEQPISTATYAWLARGYYYERRYSEAESYAREALSLEPTRLETNVLLGLIEETRGRYADALAQFAKVSRMGVSPADAEALRAGVYGAMGKRATALAMLRPIAGNSRLDLYASRDVVIGLAVAGDLPAARARLARMRYPAPIDRELVVEDPHVRDLNHR